MQYEHKEKPDYWLIQEGDLVLIHTKVFPNEYAQKILCNGHWLVVYKVSTNQRAFKCLFDPKSSKEKPEFGGSIVHVSDFVFSTKHICQVKRDGVLIFSDTTPHTQEKKVTLPQF